MSQLRTTTFQSGSNVNQRRRVHRAAKRAEVRTSAQCRYRNATPADVAFIRKRLLLESMNPLGIKPEHFTVVEQPGEGMVGFAQLQPLPAPNTYEFRSLVVLPEHRGKQIGSSLLSHVVCDSPHDIYLTTLRSTVPFYEAGGGFRLLQPSEVPWFLWFEAAAGTVVARIAAKDQLVVMHRPAPGTKK